MKTPTTLLATFLLPAVVLAQSKDNFIRQQAYAEMQRVTGQIDMVQSNVNDLQSRVQRLERTSKDSGLRAEIDALKAAVAELRRELQAQRGEIVRDLTGKIVKMQKSAPVEPAKPAKPAKPAYTGPCSEYVVQSGDNLSLIAEAFKTKPETLRQMNNLKGNNIRVGQKLLVPRSK